VNYRPARTVIKIDGTVSNGTTGDGEPEATWATQVALACEADPEASAQLSVTLDGHHDDQRKFQLKLAADGRLAGGDDSTSGLGVQLAGAAVTAATVATKVVGSLSSLVKPVSADKPDATKPATIEEQLAALNPEFATRRTNLRQALAALDDLLIADITAISRSNDPETLDGDHQSKLTAIENALTATRTEVAASKEVQRAAVGVDECLAQRGGPDADGGARRGSVLGRGLGAAAPDRQDDYRDAGDEDGEHAGGEVLDVH
jgi:hypothetical protein